jgi:formamidopyrimidine-DNA glycosylase
VEVSAGNTPADSDPWLLLHFGMTGYLSYGDKHQTVINAYGDPARPQAHVRVQFNFEDGSHLAFHEQRMFGYLALVAEPQVVIRDKKLGPDALEIEEKSFLERLKQHKGQIKPILMNQGFVAGIGNVYADEMLFQCHIHPERSSRELSAKDRACLFRQMVDVLQNTVDCRAERDELPKNYLLHSRHAKGRCPRDGALLEHKSVGGRTTYFCPVCQKD